jgi:hypothetical protein
MEQGTSVVCAFSSIPLHNAHEVIHVNMVLMHGGLEWRQHRQGLRHGKRPVAKGSGNGKLQGSRRGVRKVFEWMCG